MNCLIKQLSCYAEPILQNSTVGTIHSVYRRTVNFTNGRDILSLQANGSPLSPISLVSDLSPDDMARLNLKTGDTVYLGKGFLEFQSHASACRFLYADAQKYNLKLSKPLEPLACQTLASNIRDALSVAKTNGLSLLLKEQTEESLSLMLLAAKSHILHSNELFNSQSYQEAALELSRLLGLGIGLTPSGDDFLCGVLAGLHFTNSDEHPFTCFLKAEISRRLCDTIDISAAFLTCALEHHYSLPVNQLYQIPSPEEILAAFGEIGHSSGMDTLCGILWGLEHTPN